jgi:intein/homing endonuclease
MKYNQELAEFVGIMLGDGYINYPKQPRMKISFNSIDDKDYLHFVNKLLIKLFNSKVIVKHRKNENTSNLYLFNRKLIRLVINEIELKPSPKWNRAKIPQWIWENNFEKFVLRGYFDTDGCVVITNNNGIRYPRLEMKVSPSPMQSQFIKILKSLNFKFGVYNIGKGKVRIQMNGKKELIKWNELVGFSNQKHQRKSDSFF